MDGPAKKISIFLSVFDVHVQRAPVTGTVEQKVYRPGTYAVAIYHDENGNKKFDKNFFGLPTEGFGFSNNPGILFGPPDHDEAAFEVGDTPVTVHIDVTYL